MIRAINQGQVFPWSNCQALVALDQAFKVTSDARRRDKHAGSGVKQSLGLTPEGPIESQTSPILSVNILAIWSITSNHPSIFLVTESCFSLGD